MLALALLFLAGSVGRGEADHLYALGHYEEAANAYLELLRTNPNDVTLLEATGNSLLSLGRPRQAIPFYQRALRFAPSDLELARRLAAAFVEINEFGQAHSLLTRLTQADPADALSWYRLGLLMYQNGYYPAAIDGLDHAITLGFMGAEAAQYRNRAQGVRAIALVEAGRRDEAVRELPTLLARRENANDLDLRLSYVRLLYEAGSYGEAIKQADIALATGPENAAVHFWRARILLQEEKIPEALVEAERARGLSPDSPAPRNLLVRLYRSLGRTEDGAREAEWLRVHEAKTGEPVQ